MIFPIISQWGLSVAMETRVLTQSAPKPYAASPPPPPPPVMLHIKFDQDWPTGFRDIQVWKCGRWPMDDGPLVYYKFTLWAFRAKKHNHGRNHAVNSAYCQLYPIIATYFERHSPSLFCQLWPNLPILRASPYFLLHFYDFLFKAYKISKHLPHGNCQNLWSVRSFTYKVIWKWSFLPFHPHEIFKKLTGIRVVYKHCTWNLYSWPVAEWHQNVEIILWYFYAIW